MANEIEQNMHHHEKRASSVVVTFQYKKYRPSILVSFSEISDGLVTGYWLRFIGIQGFPGTFTSATPGSIRIVLISIGYRLFSTIENRPCNSKLKSVREMGVISPVVSFSCLRSQSHFCPITVPRCTNDLCLLLLTFSGRWRRKNASRFSQMPESL